VQKEKQGLWLGLYRGKEGRGTSGRGGEMPSMARCADGFKMAFKGRLIGGETDES
jgi:hypothetical protein